ncbi:MAG: type II secretion system protein GspG [Planctomycetes bacterium]|nr:type II secretion system protein GspG [Planctomycetota bacterium]
MTPSPTRRRQTGFTLVEVMVVILILGLVATMVATNVFPISEDAHVQRAKTDLKVIANAAKYYYQQQGRLPSMEDLTTPDEDDVTWFDDPTCDPWEQDYVLRDGDSKRSFFVVSAGPDRTLDTDDDIQLKARR